MEKEVFDVNKECYELANMSGWSLDDLRKNVPNSIFYKSGMNELSLEQILINAFIYAKKKDYLDMIVQRIARKNGKSIAYKVFKSVFPNFNKLSDLYDYCYNICQNHKDLKSISKKIGISVTTMKYYARESKLGLMYEDALRIENRRKNIEERYPMYYEIINFLYTHDNLEEIFNYLEKLNFNIEGKYLLIYASSMFPDKKPDELRESIRKKFDKYVQYKKMVINVSRDVLDNAIMTIENYVNGIYPNILSFCVINNFEKKQFRYYLALVKRHNEELYKGYQEKALKTKNKEYSVAFLELKKIVEYITYGINGRAFTLLDYFKLTNYDINVFFHLVADSLDEVEYHQVTDFYRKYKNMELLTERYILSEKREVYCQLDDKGLPMAGTGHMVTKEEKMEIIAMIKNDGYMLYGPIYSMYLKKYFNDDKAKVLKKKL